MLVTPATGAYGHAMANNYNAVPRPPVVFCRDGDARVVVRRETYEDLVAVTEAERPLRVGLLGHGTVGLGVRHPAGGAERRAWRRPAGARPELSGVLTRTAGRLRRHPRSART